MADYKIKSTSRKASDSLDIRGKTPKTKISIGRKSKSPKVLRIGIVQNGKIVEERIIRKRIDISVGPSEKNHFVLPQEDVHASRFCLFETRGPTTPYILNFQKEMAGKVSLKGKVYELHDAIHTRRARSKGKNYQVLLNDDARGKIVIGNTTVLFQFVTPPPIQPRPQLPAAVRGSLFQGLELVLSICMILSFSFHLSAITYFQLTDWPQKSLEDKYRDLQALLDAESASFDKEKEKTDEELEDGDGEDEFEKDKEKEKTPKKVKPKDTKPTESDQPKKTADQIDQERARRRTELAQQMARQGVNKILASLGGSGEGAVIDVLSGGDVAADQDDLLEQVQGVGVAQGEGNSKFSGPAGGKGGQIGADVDQVIASGGDKEVKTKGPGPEKKISGKVQRKSPTASGGTGMMSSGDVAKVVNRRIGAIKGCYEHALKRDPGLRGKITIRFTISGSGKVTTARPTLNQLNAQVGDCITAAFGRFRFPPPEGGTVTFEYPFLFSPAN